MSLPTMVGRVMVVASGGALLAGMAGPAAAQVDPPGNNGTVKIDGVAFDDHPNNEPHVGCVFQVDFYGFDEGDLDATVTFAVVPPTGPDQDIMVDDVFIGEDPAGGGTDLDASATYDLSDALADVVPHPQQGIHLRLTVHAEGSQGADTKFKEFWVTGCGAPPPTTTSTTKPEHGSTTTSTSSSTTAPSEESTTTTTKPGHGGGSSTSTPPGPSTTAPAGAGGAGGEGNSAAGQLPKTGSDAGPLAVAGLALLALGGGGVLGARRLQAVRSRH